MAGFPFPDPPLADSQLLLRPLTDADVRGVSAACQDPEIARWTLVPHPYSPEDARRFITRVEEDRVAGRELNLAISDASGMPVLGTIGLKAGAGPGIAEVGYWLARDARGRGLAASSLKLLARWALAELGLRRIEVTAHPDNGASQRVAERAGFVREGLLRDYRERKGTPESRWMFSLLPTDLGP
jgi:RimJ/RimL family protein N-acetyltransferase